MNPTLLGGNYSIAPTTGAMPVPAPLAPVRTSTNQLTTGGMGGFAGYNGVSGSAPSQSAASSALMNPSFLSVGGMNAGNVAAGNAPRLSTPTSLAGKPLTYGSKTSSAPSGSTNLADYVTTPAQLPGGGMGAVNSTGNVTSPSSFNVSTNDPISSGSLSSGPSASDIQRTLQQHQLYVNQLAQASQYSPAYLQAYQNAQNLQANDAQLANNINNPDLPYTTLGDAQTAISMARTGNAAASSSANIALQAQALARQGDIAGAQALVNATSPQSVAPGSSLVNPMSGGEVYSGLGGYQAVQGIQTVMNLAQAHADAGVLPTDSLVQAAAKVSASPSFQAQNLIAYATPSGGIGYINKLDINKLARNADGTYSLLGSADAAGQAADKASLSTQQSYLDTINRSYTTATQNLGVLQNFMQQYGINNSNVPVINQLSNAVKGNTNQAGIIAAFNSSLTGLRAEYAQVLSRGGSVTDTSRNEANSLIPNDISPAQLQQLTKQLSLEGQNAINEAQGQVNAITGRLNGAQPSASLSSQVTATPNSWGSI